MKSDKEKKMDDHVLLIVDTIGIWIIVLLVVLGRFGH